MIKKMGSHIFKKQCLKSIDTFIKESFSILALLCVLNSNTLAMEVDEEIKNSNRRISLQQQGIKEDAAQNNWEGGIFSQCYNFVSSFFYNNKRKNEFGDNENIRKKPRKDPVIEASQIICISDSEDENEEDIGIIIENNLVVIEEDNVNFVPFQSPPSYVNNLQETSPFEIKDLRTHYLIPLLDAKSFCFWRSACKAWYLNGQEYLNQLPRKQQLINILQEKNFEEALSYLTNYAKYPTTACNDLYEAAQIYFTNAIKDKDRLFQRKKIQKRKESPVNFEISPHFWHYLKTETDKLKADQAIERRINVYAPYGFALLFASRLRGLLPGPQHQSRDVVQKRNIEKLFDKPIGKLTVRYPLLNNLEKLINSDEFYFQSYKILEGINKFSKLSRSFIYHKKLQNEVKSYAERYIENGRSTRNTTSYVRAGKLFELQISGNLSPSPIDFENCAEAYSRAAHHFEDKSTKSFFYGKAAEFYEKKLRLGVEIDGRDYKNCADVHYKLACCTQDSATKIRSLIKAAEMRQEQLKSLGDRASAAAFKDHANTLYAIGSFYHDDEEFRDYTEAMKWYKLAADRNHKGAQFRVGFLFHIGYEGIPKNYSMAEEWYRKAADQSCAFARCNLGFLFEVGGYGIDQNYKTAMEWYQLATDQNHSRAQARIGNLYKNGHGVTQDYIQAMEWFQRAAVQKDAYAQSNIGWLYQHGFGVERNNIEAIKWYGLAVDQGEDFAKKQLKELENT